MIQSLPSRRSEWLLFWIEIDQPVRHPQGDVILPTLLLVTDHRGVPVAAPEMLAELDQDRAEQFLVRLFEEHGRPERLTISQAAEWDESDWKDFGSEQSIELRLRDLQAETEVRLLEAVREGMGEPVSSPSLAGPLYESAQQVRSQRRRDAYLRKILEMDAGHTAALVDLADGELGRGEWKKCLDHYNQILRLEEPKWSKPKADWWGDTRTRPYLRALYGRGMAHWHQGKHLETAKIFRQLLEINPRDHQGVRFFLPLIWLLADRPEQAGEFYRTYPEKYPGDFVDSALYFGWGLVLTSQGEESLARDKYRRAMLRNIYIAPILLEEREPSGNIWTPNDRAEPHYAVEFVNSYSVLWDREPGELRLIREVWQELQEHIGKIVEHRRKIMDFQDQRFDPEYRKHWEELLREEERLTGGKEAAL
jgi:tetratricopeptide (TPR) repeat protein